MDLEEFRRRYPRITNKQLAKICKCSVPLVYHWRNGKRGRRELKEHHRRSLAIAHFLWSGEEPEFFKEFNQIFDDMMAE